MLKNDNDYLLTSNVTVGQLKAWMIDDGAKSNIIELIQHRFYNRYLKHVKNTDSGFLMMAISCLMIETLQSFKLGIKNTNGKGKSIFKSFFEEENLLFPDFDNFPGFYRDIRCGILHQAETTNGWRVLRKGSLLDMSCRSINALKFISSLETSLNNYVNELSLKGYDAEIWTNAFIKLNDICDNCIAVK